MISLNLIINFKLVCPMILFQITILIKMGCVASDDISQPHFNYSSFKVGLKKSKIQMDSNKRKLIDSSTKLETSLLNQFDKPNGYRAKAAENLLINQITHSINKIKVYQITKGYIDRIDDYFHLLGSEDSKSLQPALRMILYVESILQDQAVSDICRDINRYKGGLKEADENTVQDKMLVHEKHKLNPSEQMQNQYILNLCNQQSLDLNKINQVGHDFRYKL